VRSAALLGSGSEAVITGGHSSESSDGLQRRLTASRTLLESGRETIDMKTRIISGIVAVFMIIGLASFTAPPAQAAVACGGILTDGQTITMAHKMNVATRKYYKPCLRFNGQTGKVRAFFIRPQKIKYGFESGKDGNHPCATGPISEIKYLEFNDYWWDTRGRNVNPGAKRLYCDNSGWNEGWINMKGSPRLYDTDQGPPRWKTNVKMEVNNGRNDNDTMYGRLPWQDFNPFRREMVK
jgi:hypothetical protein